MTDQQHSPAVRYGAVCGNGQCPCARKSPRACPKFMGLPGDPETEHWCPRCSWARWAHEGEGA